MNETNSNEWNIYSLFSAKQLQHNLFADDLFPASRWALYHGPNHSTEPELQRVSKWSSSLWTNNERVTLLLLLDLKRLCQLESIRAEVMNYFTYANKFKIQLFLTVLTRDFLCHVQGSEIYEDFRGNWVWIGDILIEFTERFLSGFPRFRLYVKKKSFKTILLVVWK